MRDTSGRRRRSREETTWNPLNGSDTWSNKATKNKNAITTKYQDQYDKQYLSNLKMKKRRNILERKYGSSVGTNNVNGQYKYISKYTNSNGNTTYVYDKNAKRANLNPGVTTIGSQRDRRTQGGSRDAYEAERARQSRMASQQARMQQIEDRKARQRRAAERDAMRERQEANQRLEERRQQSLRTETQNRLDMNEFLKNQAASNYTYKKETNLDRLKLKGQEIIGSILASTTKEKELLNKLGLNGYLKYKKGALEGKSPTLRKANQAVKGTIRRTKKKAKKTYDNATAKLKDVFNK